MNRGHRAGALFLNDADRRRFLGAAAELSERFGLELHAFVLMHNHYHLLVRTGEANLSQAIRWLNVIGRSCGGRSRAERRAALQAYTEQPIRQRVLENPWEGSTAGVVLGDLAYARRLLSGRKVNEEEQTPARRMRRRSGWDDLLKAAEAIRGEAWAEWSERHRDWGRDAVRYVAVYHEGLRLAEVVKR